MPILEITKGDNRQLQNIANVLAVANRVIVITGAGISTNCGIPVRHLHCATYSWVLRIDIAFVGLPVRGRSLCLDAIKPRSSYLRQCKA